MRHTIKTLSLSLAAVFVFGAIAAASASASQPKFEPEDKTFPITFTGSGGKGTLEVLPEVVGAETKKRTVTCTSNTSKGEVNTATSVKKVEVTFSGCTTKLPVFGFEVNANCQSGATTGVIVSKLLKGITAYRTAGSAETLVDLEPESTTDFATFKCVSGLISETLEVTGGVEGVLTPVNGAFAKSFTLTFSQTEGHQAPEGLLAPTGCAFVKSVLLTKGSVAEAFGPRQSGVEGSESLTANKNAKVVATKCE